MALVLNGSNDTITGLQINSANIVDGSIVNADINDLAASKLTGALPAISGASLTNLPSGGKLLQLKYNAKNNGASLTTSTSPAEISSDFRTTITPTSASSLIIITATLFISKTDGANLGLRLYKSSSTDMSSPGFVQSPSTINSDQDGNLNVTSNDYINVAAVVKVVELAGNTNARTYSPFWCQTGGVNSRTYLNSYSGGGYYGTSTITVEEVDIS